MTASTYPDIASYGALVFSVGIHERFETDADFGNDCNAAIGRFLRRDWGDTPGEDCECNQQTITAASEGSPGGTVMGSYTSRDGTKFWILCSGYGQHQKGADYCNTTVLFPSEY